MKENIKFMIKSGIIALLLILVFSCKKKEPHVAIFDGKWVSANAYNCASKDTLVIEFFKRMGKESKRANKYCVVGGFSIFGCVVAPKEQYFFSEFKINSSAEEFESAVAKSEREMVFEISGYYMTVKSPDFYPRAVLTLKRVK